MTSTTFFFIFIPILGFLLLIINILLAPHKPNQEKDSTFECGFHSFRGQNRSEFDVKFFVFGLLYLNFDVELMVGFPVATVLYTIDLPGLAIALIFFFALTLGFVFELGKNALSIDSRQISSLINKDAPKAHAFISLPLQSKINLHNYFNLIWCKRVNNTDGGTKPNDKSNNLSK